MRNIVATVDIMLSPACNGRNPQCLGVPNPQFNRSFTFSTYGQMKTLSGYEYSARLYRVYTRVGFINSTVSLAQLNKAN